MVDCLWEVTAAVRGGRAIASPRCSVLMKRARSEEALHVVGPLLGLVPELHEIIFDFSLVETLARLSQTCTLFDAAIRRRLLPDKWRPALNDVCHDIEGIYRGFARAIFIQVLQAKVHLWPGAFRLAGISWDKSSCEITWRWYDTDLRRVVVLAGCYPNSGFLIMFWTYADDGSASDSHIYVPARLLHVEDFDISCGNCLSCVAPDAMARFKHAIADPDRTRRFTWSNACQYMFDE